MSREREAKGKRKAPSSARTQSREGTPTPPPSEPTAQSGRPRAAAPLGPRPIARSRSGLDDPRAPVEKGSQVRVLGGAFEGKTGVVQELDGRGGARVMIGLLATRIEVRDLIVVSAGRGRPVLASSHRKPQPPS